MTNWFKKKTKPFDSSAALKKSEANKSLLEQRELKDYEEQIFRDIEVQCGYGKTSLHIYNSDKFNKFEKEMTELLTGLGYLVEKEISTSNILTSISYSSYLFTPSPASHSPIPPPQPKYNFIIKWGDKQHIFNKEMKEIINGDEK